MREEYNLEQVSIRLVSDTPLYSDKPIKCTQDAVELIGNMMSEFDREMICVVNLNQRGKPINMNVVSVGGIGYVYCEPANVFKSAILCNASYVLVLHNHPTGEPTPSREDVMITCRLIEGGKLMGIPVLDHVVIGAKKKGKLLYHSMQENGTCEFESLGAPRGLCERVPLRKVQSR